MARITKDDVEHVAHLARLSFSDDELETFTKQLDDIIGFAEELNELDTENVEPTTHVLEMSNVLRDDESREWLSREEALKNAPDQQNGQVKVPSVLE
ncbi:MAG TPA: Asp-tRNA(Asn)/Glu-tRNA(Gln) amidotransferase subunit GatC [Bacillales bacterium]|nr:Asp-tRNA(Asn)/Glu-tRNA(Gln) amidotransferase subunit GatC [Bacillales bacterium]